MEQRQHRCSDNGIVFRMFYSTDRYVVDMAADRKRFGFEQYDTSQDAWYFGVWVSKRNCEVLTYAEGDWSLNVCYSASQFNTLIAEMNASYGEGFIAKCYGGPGPDTTIVQDRSKFFLTGAQKWLTPLRILSRTLVQEVFWKLDRKLREALHFVKGLYSEQTSEALQ